MVIAVRRRTGVILELSGIEKLKIPDIDTACDSSYDDNAALAFARSFFLVIFT